MFFGKRIKLHYAIGILVIMAVVWTAVVSWYSAMNAIKDSLKENYLDSNLNYAKKLSVSTSDLLIHMQQHIVGIGKIAGNSQYDQADLDEWKAANSSYFNSIFITDSNGVIKYLSPPVVQFKDGLEVKADTKITSVAVQKALTEKRPLISDPFTALSGQRIMLISAPIFDGSGNYQGLVGGTIYLESDNVIANIINNHQYEDGSYVYVVDKEGRIIYHPNQNRLNDNVIENKVVKAVLEGKDGSAQIVNSEGNEFFAGYAYEENTGWGIISQTPTSVIQDPLHRLLQTIIIQDLPLLLVILLLAAVLANTLSKPITKLAKYSEEAFQNNKLVPLKNLNAKTHIYEVHYLYHHINNYLNLLNTQIHIDGLTGLYNRKMFDTFIKEWIENHIHFSMILLDIDRFKNVNDTHGHLIGDEVLKYLAMMIREIAGERNFCFRYGGEEFVILINHKDIDVAVKVAEKLRKNVAETKSPTGGPITISLGITLYDHKDQHPEKIIERADAALYQSKTDGRNKTTVYHNQSSVTV